MFGSPSEASVLRSLLEKEIRTSSHNTEKLEEVLEAAREAEKLILKNRNLHVDAQILAFGEILTKIKEIVWK